MKTFFAFTTGLLTGVFGGIAFTAGVLLTSKEVRDLADDLAEDLNN